MSSVNKCGVALAFQVVYFIYILAGKVFDVVLYNFIEITNESGVTIGLISLAIADKRNQFSEGLTNFYIFIILFTCVLNILATASK